MLQLNCISVKPVSFFTLPPFPKLRSVDSWGSCANMSEGGVKLVESFLVSSVGIARKDTCWIHCLLCFRAQHPHTFNKVL